MALYTRKEICEKYGIKGPTLRQHIKRGRVLEQDGYIDTSNYLNKKYLSSQSSAVSKKQTNTAPKKVTKVTEPKTVTPPPKTRKQRQEEEQELIAQKLANNLQIRKDIADTENKERIAELKRIEIEKKAGNLLPVELITKIIAINNKTIFVHMEQEIRNQAATMAKDREELALLEANMQKTLSTTIEKAKKDMLAELEGVISEFMSTRKQGEKK